MAVNYDKTTWVDNSVPAINAENLNNIENGIENCVKGVNNALPLSGGMMTGDLTLQSGGPYVKLKFTENSYIINEALGKLGIQGILRMRNASIDMNSHTITNVTDPTNAQDATTKNYVDNQLSTKLDKSGGIMTGDIGFGTGLSINPPANATTFNGIEVNGSVRLNDGLLYMNNKRIVSVATPSANTDAANKKYVDDAITAIVVPFTYSNNALSINNEVNTFNFGTNTKPILTSAQYGTALPSTGITGQIFFLLES